jgi:hypothetical protein
MEKKRLSRVAQLIQGPLRVLLSILISIVTELVRPTAEENVECPINGRDFLTIRIELNPGMRITIVRRTADFSIDFTISI